MLNYIFKRILIFIPTLFAISLLTFVISVNAPGDPVDAMLTKNGGGDGQAADKLATEKAYIETRHQFGFDLPLFYFSFTNASYPDTLYKIPNPSHRETLERLSNEYGNWVDVANYYHLLRDFELELFQIPKTQANSELLNKAKGYAQSLYDNYSDTKIRLIFNSIDFMFSDTRELNNAGGIYTALKNSYHNMLHNQNTLKKYIPVMHWYGFQNQYHRWFSHFITGDLGISYKDKRPISGVIKDALPWTMGISVLSILLAYLISIPIGVRSAVNKGKTSERVSTVLLFVLYSLPNFWIATLGVIFLCQGDWFGWFPAPGWAPIPDDASFWYTITQTSWRLALPLICWTYGSLTFISRQMRGGMLNVINQDYIRTARAKGLDEKTVIWKHALRNSLLPVITLFASVFPLAVSGSIVIEQIFAIPGMGKLSLEALLSKNYPIVYSIFMITAILTLLGNLIADILYAVVDPRISYSNKR